MLLNSFIYDLKINNHKTKQITDCLAFPDAVLKCHDKPYEIMSQVIHVIYYVQSITLTITITVLDLNYYY